MFNISCRLILALWWVESHQCQLQEISSCGYGNSKWDCHSECLQDTHACCFHVRSNHSVAADKRGIGRGLVNSLQISIVLKGLGLGVFQKPRILRNSLQKRSNFVYRPSDLFSKFGKLRKLHHLLRLVYFAHVCSRACSRTPGSMAGSRWDLAESLPSPEVRKIHILFWGARLNQKKYLPFSGRFNGLLFQLCWWGSSRTDCPQDVKLKTHPFGTQAAAWVRRIG